MGFFSFLTSDTNRSIANHWSTKSTFPVFMITEDGQVFCEKDYEGYGVFEGKDIYQLSAEMNGYKGDTDDETRNLFFDKIWVRGIKNGDKIYNYKEHFTRYDVPIESEGGICANDLIKHHGWEGFGEGGEFKYWAERGLKIPKLVETPPTIDNMSDWKTYWDSLSYPESCPNQGFFYDDEEDDDEDVDGGDYNTWNEAPYGEGEE